jgi:tol-pal system protein YbgF
VFRIRAFVLPAVFSLIACLGCEPSTPKGVIESELSGQAGRIENLNIRLTRVEKWVESIKASLDERDKNVRQVRADQAVALEDLRTEVKTLSGSLDVVKHDTELSTRNAQKVREDFDARLAEIEQRLNALLQAAESTPQTREERTVGDTAKYNQIWRAYRNKKTKESATEQFRQFVTDYPKSQHAPEAQYWVGVATYDEADYARAISDFQTLIDKYPQSDKVCDAMLKQGLGFVQLKDTAKAKLFLGEVPRRCPKTPAAAKASERLSKLAGGGSKQ